MVGGVERELSAGSVFPKKELSVEVVGQAPPNIMIDEARQEGEEQVQQSDNDLSSPQEMGQEALWVDNSPRRFAWTIASPSNDSAKKSQTHNAKILLLDGSGATGRVEIAVDPVSTSHSVFQKREQAREKAQVARSILTRALANSSEVQRLRLAESAFQHANEALQLLDHEKGTTCDQELVQEKAFLAIRSAGEAGEATVWQLFNALLPDTLGLTNVKTEHIDDQDISTLGFNNTFELPSTKNDGSRPEGFDLMSMSSLNEILDGPLDESPRHHKSTGKKKKRLRIVKLFRSRKPDSSDKEREPLSAGRDLERAPDHEGDCKVLEQQPKPGPSTAADDVEGQLLMERPLSNSRTTSRHIKPQEEIAIYIPPRQLVGMGSARQLAMKRSPNDAKASSIPTNSPSPMTIDHLTLPAAVVSCDMAARGDVDDDLELVAIPSQSPSLTGGMLLDDRYKISIFEAGDTRDKYEFDGDKDDGSCEMWNPCGECNGKARRKSDRYAPLVAIDNEEQRPDRDLDEEKETSLFEEDKYLVENDADDDSLRLPSKPTKQDSTMKDQPLRKRSFLWFQRRNNVEPSSSEVLTPHHDEARFDMSVLQQAVPTESAPLKRSISKRSSKSNHNASSGSSASIRSRQKSAPSTKKRRKPLKSSPAAVDKPTLKSQAAHHFVESRPEVQYFPSILRGSRSAIPSAYPSGVSEDVVQVKISALPSMDEGKAATTMVAAGRLMPVIADDPLFHSIKAQQSRHHRRGLDPATATDGHDDRGIDP